MPMVGIWGIFWEFMGKVFNISGKTTSNCREKSYIRTKVLKDSSKTLSRTIGGPRTPEKKCQQCLELCVTLGAVLFLSDINECMDESVCVGGQCLNTDGSYMCFCTHPMVLDDSGTTCVMMPDAVGKKTFIHVFETMFDGDSFPSFLTVIIKEFELVYSSAPQT